MEKGFFLSVEEYDKLIKDELALKLIRSTVESYSVYKAMCVIQRILNHFKEDNKND